MAFNLLAWNTYNAFGDPDRSAEAVKRVLNLNPDVAIFGEAYDSARYPEIHEDQIDIASNMFRRAGYYVQHTPYNDEKHYGMKHGMMAISCLPWDVEIVRLGTRDSLSILITDPDTKINARILGVHFDHRYEDRRCQQSHEALELWDGEIPFVATGDMNTMHFDDWRAKLIRSPVARVGSRLLPTANSRKDARDLIPMALGGALKILENDGLRDADPTYHATMKSHLPLVQLDHVMASERIKVIDFSRHGYSHVSDHRAISAILEATPPLR